MEHLGPKENNNNINPYITEYEELYSEYHLLLADQNIIGWDKLLRGILETMTDKSDFL